MIFDHISNIERYKNLGFGIYQGLMFIKNQNENCALGRHQLQDENYANVEEYTTKIVNPNGYEAHKKYIDIQFLLKGKEKILSIPREKIDNEISQQYDETRDIMFFNTINTENQSFIIGDGYFVIFFPEDAHQPQLAYKNPELVKKIVVKCKC